MWNLPEAGIEPVFPALAGGFFFSFLYFIFYLLNFYFNWRLITLQYCGGFAIHSHASATGVHSQCTSPERPASCIKPGLAICFTYGNIHVSMLFSQIIPPFPSPTESNSLFFTSVSLLLSRIQGYHYIFLNSIYVP